MPFIRLIEKAAYREEEIVSEELSTAMKIYFECKIAVKNFRKNKSNCGGCV